MRFFKLIYLIYSLFICLIRIKIQYVFSAFHAGRNVKAPVFHLLNDVNVSSVVGASNNKTSSATIDNPSGCDHCLKSFLAEPHKHPFGLVRCMVNGGFVKFDS